MLSRAGSLVLRNLKNCALSTKRYSHEGGVPGENLPFGKSLGRPGKLSFLFMVYFGSGLWAPFLIFTYQYTK